MADVSPQQRFNSSLDRLKLEPWMSRIDSNRPIRSFTRTPYEDFKSRQIKDHSAPQLSHYWSSSSLQMYEATSSFETAPVRQFERPAVYLGWRSTEHIVNYPKTPSERLASSLLKPPVQNRSYSHDNLDKRQPVLETKELPHYHIHDSIRSVTSAIINYCDDTETQVTKNNTGKKKVLWIESSFVTKTLKE